MFDIEADLQRAYNDGYKCGRLDALAELLKYIGEMGDYDGGQTDPQTELVRVKYHCINCAENGSYKCSKCDGEMYYKYDKDEPQTERSE